MKKSKQGISRCAAIVWAAFLCIAISGCRYGVSWGDLFSRNGNFDYEYDQADRYLAGGGTCEEEIRTLDIDWVSGSVEIRTYDGDVIEFYEESDQTIAEEYQMRYTVDGDILKIRFCASGIWNGKNLSKRLTVLVPTGLSLEEVRVDTVSAGIVIQDVIVSGVDVDTTSGDLYAKLEAVESVKADIISGEVEMIIDEAISFLELETVSGQVNITAASLVEFDIETVSGALDLSLSQQSSGQIESVSGNVNIRLPETVGYQIDYESVSGAFSSDLDYETGNGWYRSGDGSCRIQAETISGNLRVEKP